MNIAVFGVDPGGKTGTAWGVFNPAVDPWEALRTVLHHGQVTVTGNARQQFVEIAQLWSSFFNLSVKRALLPPERVWLVVEDFVYAPGVSYVGEDARISTQITWGLEGYRMGRRDEFLQRPGRKAGRTAVMPQMILQTASAAKSFATPQRFKAENLWVRGYAGKNEHVFSAWQHIAFFLKTYRTRGGT